MRNKYPYRAPDGSYIEYNETITIVPKEFEKQGNNNHLPSRLHDSQKYNSNIKTILNSIWKKDEYKREKQLTREYAERYRRHQEAKRKLYSLQLPKQPDSSTNASMIKASEAKPPCPHTDKIDQTDPNKPIRLEQDPFRREPYQCIFCRHNIKLDYKNVQLLSQFVSPHTGIVYSQQATGLCYFKQDELEKTVHRAKMLGLMPFFYKETVFLNDPKLFDPYNDNLKRVPNNYDNRSLTADDELEKSRKSIIQTSRDTAK